LGSRRVRVYVSVQIRPIELHVHTPGQALGAGAAVQLHNID